MKKTDSEYMNICGLFMFGYSVNKAARILGVNVTTIKNRVKHRTIEYFKVNDRVFITDLGIACYGKMPEKKRDIPLQSIIELDCMRLYYRLKEVGDVPIPGGCIYSDKVLWFILKLMQNSILVKPEKVRVQVTFPIVPKEILENEKYSILCQKMKGNLYMLQAYNLQAKTTLLPAEYPEKDFLALKKDFISETRDYEKKYCLFIQDFILPKKT